MLAIWIVIYAIARRLFARDTRRATWAASFGTVILVAVMAYIGVFDYLDDHWATCHVTAKSPDGSSSEGVVYTSNCGALSVRDTWNRESDFKETWDAIVVGKSYDFRLAGMRLELKVVDWFPNIIDIKPASK
jgi:hypothetical protein